MYMLESKTDVKKGYSLVLQNIFEFFLGGGDFLSLLADHVQITPLPLISVSCHISGEVCVRVLNLWWQCEAAVSQDPPDPC